MAPSLAKKYDTLLRFWALAKPEWQEVAALFETDEARQMITALKNSDKDDRIKLLDAAYWVKGCSSLGRIRYAALVGIGKGMPTPDSMCLIDIKEGVAPAAPPFGQNDDAAGQCCAGGCGRPRIIT